MNYLCLIISLEFVCTPSVIGTKVHHNHCQLLKNIPSSSESTKLYLWNTSNIIWWDTVIWASEVVSIGLKLVLQFNSLSILIKSLLHFMCFLFLNSFCNSYFKYSYTNSKSRHTHTGLFFHKCSHTKSDGTWYFELVAAYNTSVRN
jgi:hypothetical protein